MSLAARDYDRTLKRLLEEGRAFLAKGGEIKYRLRGERIEATYDAVVRDHYLQRGGPIVQGDARAAIQSVLSFVPLEVNYMVRQGGPRNDLDPPVNDVRISCALLEEQEVPW